MGVHLKRALILFQQSRLDLAEPELKLELQAEPNEPYPHALLALCLAHREAHADATREAEAAIGLGPDFPFAHYVHGTVLKERNRLDEALAAAREAIRLDPTDPDHHGLASAIHLEKGSWREALASAEAGLAQDPEHVTCSNLRAVALVKLGRKAEAGATIGEALRKDPENPMTHANQGWTLLEQGQPKQAMEHFREALRLEPGFPWAREGLIEAMKARHVIYGLMLRYFLWMAKLSPRTQWFIILGGFFASRLLRGIARTVPAFAPFILPILILYAVFCLLTWTADAVFNLLLCFSRFGRHALTREQRIAAACVGACLGLGLVCLVAFVGTEAPATLIGAQTFGFLAIPVSATFHCQRGWPRSVMGAYTLVLLLVGLGGFYQALRWDEDGGRGEGPFGVLSGIFFLGVFVSQWVANALVGARVKR